MTKRELRALYLQKRAALSESEHAALSQKLCDNFFKHIDLANVKVLHSFLPIIQKKEPNTWLIIDELKKRFPTIKVSIPKINSNGILENYYFENNDQLKKSIWGIPEPGAGEPTDSKDIDLVIVPLLAFDKQGNRVGYGKGHYDRFLKTCRSSCQKIGISFFEPEDIIEDTFAGDIPLNNLITSEKFYGFS